MTSTISLRDLKINRVLYFRENKKHDELCEGGEDVGE